MMRTTLRLLILFYCLMLSLIVQAADDEGLPLKHIAINLHDQAALQRGARLFMNYCSGCHSLQYLRYNRLAKDIGIVDDDGQVDADLLKENLIFTTAKISDHILTALPTADAEQWFGVAPPDLTLVARVRGADWLYTYLTSFYQDKQRPFASNNWIFPDVAMPNVLAPLQGEQAAVFIDKRLALNGASKTVKVIDHLLLVTPGSMSQFQFDSSIQDLVTFLVYVAEPMRLERQSIGLWVILFLLVLLGLAVALKREYWKDVK